MSKVILCADDSVTMQTVAEITFRATEFGYAGARSVDEAIEKVKAQRPALVLADAMMPGKTGYDLCQALKSDPATADIPVVILCGNSAPFDGARGTQVGADGSLTKPWDTQVMLDKVVEILDKVAASGVAKAAGRGAPAPVAAPPPVAPPAPIAPPVVQVPAAAAAAQPKVAPPRSATIMGMPTIKMPGPAPAPAPTPAPAPVAAAPVAAPPAPRPASSTGPIATGPATVRGVAPVAAPVAQFSTARAPMVSGVPSKRSALVERTLAKMGERLAELSGLAPGSAELTALVKLSSEIVERVVWEVVPDLAETIIREHVSELAKRAN